MKTFIKSYVYLLKKLELGSAIAVRLTKITGKSEFPIHPKHFLTNKPWFSAYLKKTDVLLDLGCGNGQNSIKASYMVKRVIGVDLNRDILNQAVQTAKRRKRKNISFKNFNLEKKLNFQNNYFDKVLFLDVLEHLKKREQILQELKRIIKPGGLLLLGVPNSQTSWKKLQREAGFCSYSDPDHKIEFSQKQIEKLVNKYFHILYLGYGNYDTPLRGLIDILGGLSISSYKEISKWRREKARQNPQEAGGFEIIAVKK